MIDNVINVEFVSVWDDGVGIETSAKYNPKTGLVYDIETTDEDVEELEILESEYIYLPNGELLSVSDESGEYKVIDFAKMLREVACSDEELCTGEDYPLFDEVLINFANDNDVILKAFDIEKISSQMDIDSDGYPYIEQRLQIPKYKCRFTVKAYHHNKWDFYIEDFKLIED